MWQPCVEQVYWCHFSTAFAHLVFLCQILVILTILHNSPSLVPSFFFFKSRLNIGLELMTLRLNPKFSQMSQPGVPQTFSLLLYLLRWPVILLLYCFGCYKLHPCKTVDLTSKCVCSDCSIKWLFPHLFPSPQVYFPRHNNTAIKPCRLLLDLQMSLFQRGLFWLPYFKM